MKRREFIALLGSVAVAWPLAAGAQQHERVRRVVFLHSLAENDPEVQGRIAAFWEGLEALGWTENRNIQITHSLSVEIGPKRLELLHELAPTATVMAALINPSNPNAEPQSKALEAAAGAIGVQLHIVHASTERDLDKAFASLAQLRAHALVIAVDGFFNTRNEELGRLALRYALPAIFLRRNFVAAGGLMSYGESITETYRLAGVYAGRIVRGEKPAELPVLQATKFELTINLKTAQALGLTVPLPLLGRADEVIE